MTFEMLDPTRDRDRWLGILDKLPADRRDVHWTPQYLAAERIRGHDPRLAVYSYREYVVCQPVVIRDIFPDGAEHEAPEALWTCRDISSPYGYGGPLSNHGFQLYEWFGKGLEAWAVQNRVVTEFCALHPFMLQHQLGLLKIAANVKPKPRKQIVWMDLTGDWRSTYHDNRRQGVKKAKAAGVKISLASSSETFVRLYRETMLRKRASPRWFFPDEYLEASCNNGVVFYASQESTVLSAAIMLGQAGHTAYYHLAANVADQRVCANDLLLDHIADCAVRHGCKRLHLGGGATAESDDRILFFKAGFSDLRAPAMSYFRVFDEVTYKALCAEKARREVAQTGAEFATAFEPMYRREVS